MLPTLDLRMRTGGTVLALRRPAVGLVANPLALIVLTDSILALLRPKITDVSVNSGLGYRLR